MTKPLLVACGALTRELRAVLGSQDLDDAAEVRYLPAHLHNRPDRIVPAIDEILAGVDTDDRDVLIGYADCGTGGALDRYIDDRAASGAGTRTVRRLPGAHCYELFAGAERFDALHEAEPGTFYLTDFLAKHFDALVWQGLGLDRYPELRSAYFGNYRRVVLLSQSGDPSVVEAAIEAADRLGLELEHVHTGRDRLADAVSVGLAPRTPALAHQGDRP